MKVIPSIKRHVFSWTVDLSVIVQGKTNQQDETGLKSRDCDDSDPVPLCLNNF